MSYLGKDYEDCPPALPVKWRFYVKGWRKLKRADVVAKTWFEARGIAARELGEEPGRLWFERR